MKCVMCDREMDKAAAWVGGLPIGPKCLQKMGDKPTKVKGNVVTYTPTTQADRDRNAAIGGRGPMNSKDQ